MEEFTLKFTTEVEFKLLIPFTVNDKMYSAFIPTDNIYFLRTREIPSENTVEFLTIDNKSEFDNVLEYFEKHIINGIDEDEYTV